MKFAALALGFLATAFAVAVDHYFGASRQLLAPWSGSGDAFLGTSLFYVLAGAGLVGGLLALPSPLSGGLLLLAAACGWFWLGASISSGFSVVVVVPLALCLLGSIFGVLAAGHSPPRAEVKRVPRLVDDEPRPSLEELEREAALSRDLASHFEGLTVPEVAPETQAADPAPPPASPRRSDRMPRRRPSLVLVLMIANLVLSAFLALAVLLLYLELRNAGS